MGGVNYFHYENSSGSFGNVKWHVKKGFERTFGNGIRFGAGWKGIKDFRQQGYNNEYGLHKVPITARWLCQRMPCDE